MLSHSRTILESVHEVIRHINPLIFGVIDDKHEPAGRGFIHYLLLVGGWTKSPADGNKSRSLLQILLITKILIFERLV